MSFACIKCGAPTKVIDTRAKLKGYRRRKCRDCGYRFSTVELLWKRKPKSVGTLVSYILDEGLKHCREKGT